MLLVPLVIFIVLFFHKLCRKDTADGAAVLKLSDLLERYLFPQNQVMVSTRVGKGAYGTIYKGYAHKILNYENETLVAIKEVKGSPEEVKRNIFPQKVDFEKLVTFEETFMMFFWSHILVAIFGIGIKDFDAMRRTFESGQFAWSRYRKYCQP